jgi:hypothetical protein
MRKVVEVQGEIIISLLELLAMNYPRHPPLQAKVSIKSTRREK